MPGGYLFDLDGTLVDRLPSLKRFLPEQYARCRTTDTLLADGFAARFLELEEGGHRPKDEVYKTLIRESGLSASVAELVADFRVNAYRVCETQPGALAVLERLQLRGARLGVVTNGSVTAQEQKLKASGLAARVAFSLIAVVLRVHRGSPGERHRGRTTGRDARRLASARAHLA